MHKDLLGAPPPTLLPDDAPVRDALAAGTAPAEVAAAHPAAPAAWAALAEAALADDDSHRRVGHRLRLRPHRLPPRPGPAAPRRLEGPRPGAVVARANRGFLRALNALGLAAERIGETEEAERCATFLGDSDPEAFKALRG